MYTKEDITPEALIIENLARYMCELDGVEADRHTTGLNVTMPSGTEYALWEIRVPKARAIRKWLAKNQYTWSDD